MSEYLLAAHVSQPLILGSTSFYGNMFLLSPHILTSSLSLSPSPTCSLRSNELQQYSLQGATVYIQKVVINTAQIQITTTAIRGKSCLWYSNVKTLNTSKVYQNLSPCICPYFTLHIPDCPSKLYPIFFSFLSLCLCFWLHLPILYLLACSGW